MKEEFDQIDVFRRLSFMSQLFNDWCPLKGHTYLTKSVA